MIKYTEYKYHAAALFTVAVWGATFVSTKVLIAHSLTPAEIFLLRFALAYVCIWPLSKGRLRADGWRDEALLAAAGVTGGSLYFLTENMALEYAPASNVSLIVCTAPVWTALLLSLVYRGERMTRRQIGGSALAFAGMVLVVLNGRFVLHLSPKGDLLAPVRGAAVDGLFAGGQTHRRPLPRRFHHPQGLLLRTADDPSGIRLPALLGRRGGTGASAVWGNLLFLGVVASMLCYILWNAAMHRLGAVRTTNYIYFNPLVTIVTAALCIGERITAAALAGAALILYGMWRAERRPASGNKIPRPDVP